MPKPEILPVQMCFGPRRLLFSLSWNESWLIIARGWGITVMPYYWRFVFEMMTAMTKHFTLASHRKAVTRWFEEQGKHKLVSQLCWWVHLLLNLWFSSLPPRNVYFFKERIQKLLLIWKSESNILWTDKNQQNGLNNINFQLSYFLSFWVFT